MRLSGPVALDALAPVISFAPGGTAAIGSGWFDPDRPVGAQSSLTVLAADGHGVSRHPLPGVRRVLDAGFYGGTLELLAATSPHGQACCTQVETLSLGARGFSARALLRGLHGAALGRLIAISRGVLAAVASSTGVWVAQASRLPRFGPAHRLTPGGVSPSGLAAAALRGARTAVVWSTGRLEPADVPPPVNLMLATGSSSRAPGAPRVALTLAAGHELGEMALAPAPTPTLAWVEDFSDSAGQPESQIVAADLSRALRTHAFPQTGLASGIAADADSAGEEVLAWKVCDQVPVCQVMAVSRPRAGRFGTPSILGSIDAGTAPAVAVAAGGRAVVGWVLGGRVELALRSSASARFAPPRALPGSGAAAQLTLAGGPRGRLLAVWSDGAPQASLLASSYLP